MSNIFDGFSNSEINDHNADFSVSRIISENKLQGPLSEFLKDHFSSTEIKKPEDFAAAVRSAAKLSEPREQLTEFLRVFKLTPVINPIRLRSNSNVASALVKEAQDWLQRKPSTLTGIRCFPDPLAEQIKKAFFPESPLELCKVIFNLLREDGFIFCCKSLLYLDILRLYGDEPFEVLFSGTTSSNCFGNQTIYNLIWEPLRLESVVAEKRPSIESYKDCLSLSRTWHNRLVQLGCIDQATQWEEAFQHISHEDYDFANDWVRECIAFHPKEEDFATELTKHLDILKWQRLCHPEARKDDYASKQWLELSFELKKSFYHDDSPEELIDQFIDESLKQFSWKDKQYCTLPPLETIGRPSPTNFPPVWFLPMLWYSSSYKERWLEALDSHIANSEPSRQLEIFDYLFARQEWQIGDICTWEDTPNSLCRKRDLPTIRVEDKTLNRWAAALFALGKAFMQNQVRLSHEELIKWINLIDAQKDRISVNRNHLVPYADKALAFLRPHLYQQSKEVNLYTISSACSIILNYTPEQFLRNLLQAFRKCPIACSGKGLEFGAGSNILANYDYPLPWWISILISNCLRLPYACLEALKPHVYQHDPQGNKLDYTGNPIEEDGFYKDGQGKSIDKNGQIVDFKKPDKITKMLREEFTQFCFKSILLKKNQKCTPNTFYDEAQCTEPDAYWRQGFIRALDEIGLDLGGEVHRRLNFVADHDPNEAVREIAREAYQALRRKHHLKEADPVKGLLIAFWTLRLAQHKALNEVVDPQEATKTRRNELRYATNVQNVISLISY
jgi:hypothetical protein